MEESPLQDALNGLEGSIQEAQQKMLDAQADFADKLGNARQVLRGIAGTVEKQKGSVESLFEEARAKLRVAEEAAGEMAGGAASAEQVEELEAVVKELEIRLEKEAEKIGEWKTRAEEAEKALEEQRAAEGGEKEKLEAEAKAAREEAESLRQELEAKATAVTAAEEAAEAARKEAAEHKERLEAQSAAEGDLSSALEEAKAAKAAAEEELAAAKRDAEEARKAGEAVTSECKRLRSELDDLRQARDKGLSEEAANALRQELEDAQNQRRMMEEQLAEEQAKGTKSVLATQLAEALKDAEDARNELRTLRMQGGGAAAEVPPVSTLTDTERVREAAQRLGGQKRTLGELLVEAKLVSQDHVDDAIQIQKGNPQQHVGAILIDKGHASEEAVAQALAWQCDVPFVQLGDEAITPEAATAISQRLAQQHMCIPIQADDNSLTLAMQNPLDLLAIEDVERATSRSVDVVVSTPKEIKAAIDKFYWEP